MSFKVKGYDNKLSTCLFDIFCLSRLWENAELEVESGTDQICQDCRRFASINIAIFAWHNINNAGFVLFSKEDTANTKKIKKLICCISKDEDGSEVATRVTNFVKKKTFFIDLSIWFVFQFVPKTIIIKFC